MSSSNRAVFSRLRSSALAVVSVGFLAMPVNTEQPAAALIDDAQEPKTTVTKRGATVRDVIEMKAISLGDDSGGEDPIIFFSPDHSKAIVVLQRGNLDNNTNEYSMLLWTKSGLLSGALPKLLLTMASSSFRPAIRHLKWLNDNRTVLFMGESPGELQQLYSLDVETRTSKKLTDHATSVDAYDAGADGQNFVFTANPVEENLFDHGALRHGYIINPHDDALTSLILGKKGAVGPSFNRADQRLFIGTTASLAVRSIALIEGVESKGIGTPYLSPDGTKAVIPLTWEDGPAHTWKVSSLSGDILFRWVLIDLTSGTQIVILNSPCRAVSEAAWSQDGRHVVLSNVYLPVNQEMDLKERQLRHDTTYPVEVNVETLEYHLVEPAGSMMKLMGWDWATDALLFRDRESTKTVPDIIYRRSGDHWEKVPNAAAALPAVPWVIEEQDMNTPPTLVVVDPVSAQKKQLLRLNPQFEEIEFSKVEALQWKTKTGQQIDGGLYYPLRYVPGKKYPLVIQTHGFNARLFQPDGPFPSGSAAQPLAALGIMVFQLNDNCSDLGTLNEVRCGGSQFDEVIHYLDAKRLIDPTHVGIVGFSRTGFYVKYAVTHSPTKFFAAVTEDDWDGSYWQYLADSTTRDRNILREQEKGSAKPFGAGLSVWLKESTDFNAERVNTPFRMVAYRPSSLLFAWGWFSALKLLGKPAEMVLLQYDAHQLKMPWNRDTSLQGNVDWFDFWLNQHEDPDPAKADQYKRWEAMRDHRKPASGGERNGGLDR
jgi:dipeptidyl aminopeptidase/acylaminoacyl peptidase